MGIHFNEERRVFKLDTEHTTYLIGLTVEGYVGHVYYGRRLQNIGGLGLLRIQEHPFTPSKNKREKSAFLDSFPTEYPTGGIGD